MILLKSCMVLIGHVSRRIFNELLAADRGRTLSFRCKCFADKRVHRRCVNRHSRIAVDGVISDDTSTYGHQYIASWQWMMEGEPVCQLRDVTRTDPHVVMTSQISFRKIPESEMSVWCKTACSVPIGSTHYRRVRAHASI